MIAETSRGTWMDTPQDLRPKPRKWTIVIGTVIALIVILSVEAVVILMLRNESDNVYRGGTPISTLSKSNYLGDDKFTFSSLTRDTPWTGISIQLTDGANTVTWSPLTTNLDNGTTSKYNSIASAANLGTLKVNISIVDLAGNGYINGLDYFVLRLGPGQTFSSATTYTVTIMHNPSGSAICHLDFQG